MRKTTFYLPLITLLTSFTLFSTSLRAQSASEILESGEHVHEEEKLILQFQNESIEYDLVKSLSSNCTSTNFGKLNEGAILLPSNNHLNVYLIPTNPLNFSHKTDILFTDDLVEQEFNATLGSITSLLGNVEKFITEDAKSRNASLKKTDLQNYFDKADALKNLLEKDIRPEIKEIFLAFKSIDFSNKVKTKESFQIVSDRLENLLNNYNQINKEINLSLSNIESTTFKKTENKVELIVARTIYKELKEIHHHKMKLIEPLLECRRIMAAYITKAEIGGKHEGLNWCIPLERAEIQKGKVLNYTIRIYKSGFNVNEEGEILKAESQLLIERKIFIRKFDRFVPEVAAALVYTNFNYSEFGTSTNENGEQIVSENEVNNLTNFKASGMINLNLFIENSSVHPLWQLGFSTHRDAPIIMSGFGLRTTSSGLNRFAISGGLAMTWMKSLNSLSLGDVVDGTGQINEDLILSAPKYSPYIAIQYNF